MLRHRRAVCVAVLVLALVAGACGGAKRSAGPTTSRSSTPRSYAAPPPATRGAALLTLPNAGTHGETLNITLLTFDAGISSSGSSVSFRPLSATVTHGDDEVVSVLKNNLPSAQVVSAATGANGHPVLTLQLTSVSPVHDLSAGHIALSYHQVEIVGYSPGGAQVSACWTDKNQPC